MFRRNSGLQGAACPPVITVSRAMAWVLFIPNSTDNNVLGGGGVVLVPKHTSAFDHRDVKVTRSFFSLSS